LSTCRPVNQLEQRLNGEAANNILFITFFILLLNLTLINDGMLLLKFLWELLVQNKPLVEQKKKESL
jgi:hypothetical protein